MLYGTDVISWTKSELPSLRYTLNSAMCKINKVKFQLLDSIYKYTNEIDIANVIKHRLKNFMSKLQSCSNSVIRHICSVIVHWLYCLYCLSFIVHICFLSLPPLFLVNKRFLSYIVKTQNNRFTLHPDTQYQAWQQTGKYKYTNYDEQVLSTSCYCRANTPTIEADRHSFGFCSSSTANHKYFLQQRMHTIIVNRPPFLEFRDSCSSFYRPDAIHVTHATNQQYQITLGNSKHLSFLDTHTDSWRMVMLHFPKALVPRQNKIILKNFSVLF